MYDNATQAANAQYNANALMASQGNATLGSTPQPVIAQAMLQELQALLEKARSISIRQSNLRERIFGVVPESAQIEKSPAVQNGFLHEANDKIQSLHVVLDRITQNCNELERLA